MSDDDPAPIGERPTEGPAEDGPPAQPSVTTEPSAPDEDDDEEGPRHFLRELPVLVLIAFGLALLIKTFFAQAFYIPSESMLPTLEVDDRVLVNKLVYRFREPRRGEIIVFVEERDARPRPFLQRVRSFFTEGLGVVRPQEKDFIKRVIALPGETIAIDELGRVSITPPGGGNPMLLNEPYIAEELDETSFGPFVVPRDDYFVMGDNRAHSSDSRSQLGTIPRSHVIGKAFMRIWPAGRVGFFRTPSYDPAAARAPAGEAGWVAVAAAVVWPAWSPTGVWSSGSVPRGSGSSLGWTRRAAARWPDRWSPAR